MKLSTALLTIAFSFIPICSSISFLGREQAVLDSDTDLSVPGDNPLVFCQDPSDYILAIEHVDLDPNPPNAYVRFACFPVTDALTSECRH